MKKRIFGKQKISISLRIAAKNTRHYPTRHYPTRHYPTRHYPTLSYSLFERYTMKTTKSIRNKNGGQSGRKIRLFLVPQKEWRASQVGKKQEFDLRPPKSDFVVCHICDGWLLSNLGRARNSGVSDYQCVGPVPDPCGVRRCRVAAPPTAVCKVLIAECKAGCRVQRACIQQGIDTPQGIAGWRDDRERRLEPPHVYRRHVYQTPSTDTCIPYLSTCIRFCSCLEYYTTTLENKASCLE